MQIIIKEEQGKYLSNMIPFHGWHSLFFFFFFFFLIFISLGEG